VPNCAAIAAPLTDLTKRGSPEELLWTDVQEQAFETLKSHVCAKPVLSLPDINKPFILQTDASADGIGAILLQEVDSVKRPVGFASKKLLPRERNYSTIEREALEHMYEIVLVMGYSKVPKLPHGYTLYSRDRSSSSSVLGQSQVPE